MTKVSLVRCADYNADRVVEAVKRSVDLVGGIESYVKPGMKVLLKPNLLSARPPEDGVDTHPEVVRALVRLVKASGATPIIGDSPGGYGKNIDEIFDKSGMRNMARQEGVELVKFINSKSVNGVPISRYVFECDCIISIPKFKTHGITVLTGAIKNTYGMVVGLYKAERHSIAPREKDFARIIAKIYSMVTPNLSVLDGIVAMEGDGPNVGSLRKMGFVMAGHDAVGMDACLAKMMGLEPLDILVTKESYEKGLGEADLSRIEIAGERLEDFIVKDFKLPQTTALKLIPRSIAKGVGAFIRFKPYIDKSVCARCNLCKLSCPVSAIEIEKNRCKIDYKRCVRCLCCQEVCPYKAIKIKRNILTKMVWG